MIKSVVFDLDDTLYDFTSAHAVALHRMADYAWSTLEIPRERFDALQRVAFQRQKALVGETAALHNRLIRCQMMLEAAGKSVFHAPDMANLYWNALLERIRPLPGTNEALGRLRSLGLTVGLGSNMTADWQFAKLKRLGLMAYLDFIVTSEEAGADKPDPRLFRLCAEKAGCAPGECVFVGDSLERDALGAQRAGMIPVWLRRKGETDAPPEGVRVIRDLRELPRALEESVES